MKEPDKKQQTGKQQRVEEQMHRGRMSKERITKPDGRYLIFYRFTPPVELGGNAERNVGRRTW
ncbi:MAG: hypothetical protein M1379_07670 [Firmicutes bacterium]|nr:hypothetical protein [Bacillota bacterium]